MCRNKRKISQKCVNSSKKYIQKCAKQFIKLLICCIILIGGNMLKRKIDEYLIKWKENNNRKPLIVKGARQIGKTTSIREFGKTYQSFIEINFLLEPKYKNIFSNGYSPDDILKEISILNSECKIIPYNTLILFDEIQSFPDAVTSLKAFKEDGKYDVICSGSLLGVNYKKINSIPVGFKEDYTMYSLDFEEFLWAKGYTDEHIDYIYSFMKNLIPLPDATFNTFSKLYEEYIFCGGMPEAVNIFVNEKNYSNVFPIQNRIYQDYQDDISKYVEGLDTARVKNVYRHITSQLAKENHKFQLSHLGHGARFRDYRGCEEWLKDAGVVNLAYNLNILDFPFKGNEDETYFRMYYGDTSLLIATLDEESKEDLTINKNFGIYKGALYENLISEALIKQGYDLFFYKTKDATVELDFVIRVKNEIIPIEVKSNRGRSKSLNTIMNTNSAIKYGVKLTHNNIGYSENKFTFPYFLTFLLKRFFKENNIITW